jgi:hypothetical protein
MSDNQQTNTSTPTILTLTLPHPDGEAALLIQRGELAHMRQFAYTQISDITEAVQAATDALALIESNPPVVPDIPPEKVTRRTAPPLEPEQPREPMIDIPTKKGKVAIPVSYLHVSNGDPGSEVYQQAVQIAGRLIDGKLWDGKFAICIDDVADAQRKLKHLSDKEMSLFELEDFARRVTDEEPSTTEEVTQDLSETADDTGGEDDLPHDTPDDEPAPVVPALVVETNQPGLL